MSFPVGGYADAAAAAADGVLFNFPLNEGVSGEDAIDGVGSYDLTVAGTPDQTGDGVFDKCAKYDSTGGRHSLSIPNPGGTHNPFSASVWLRKDAVFTEDGDPIVKTQVTDYFIIKTSLSDDKCSETGSPYLHASALSS